MTNGTCFATPVNTTCIAPVASICWWSATAGRFARSSVMTCVFPYGPGISILFMMQPFSWPIGHNGRAPHWKALLTARAIENQCYVAGVNRVGKDGNGYYHSGDSRIVDPLGQRVAGRSDQEGIITGVFSAKVLQDYRNQFPAWMDADKELITKPKSIVTDS